MWKGDLAEALLAAEAAGSLTDRLVAQAAGVSQPAWRRAAAAYASQLAKQGDHLAASEYYLASHQVQYVHAQNSTSVQAALALR